MWAHRRPHRARPAHRRPHRARRRRRPRDALGPARARNQEAVIAQHACEACHLAEAAEWRVSLHHTADVEPSYRRAFAIEPLPFCRGCHAPEASPEEPETEAVAALGVGCVTCHVTNGAVLAAPWTGASVPPPAPRRRSPL